MPLITPRAIAMGIGANGAMVDVSSFVLGTEGLSYKFGRTDEFQDVQVGTFQFTLENQDGRFSPNNAASPLATLVTEGMPVCWQLGTRLVSGEIQSIAFPTSEDQWGRVTITAMDMLGIANRTDLTDLAYNQANTEPYLFWPLNDPAGSGQALEVSGNNGPPLLYQAVTTPAVFGVATTFPTADTMVTLNATVATPSTLAAGVTAFGAPFSSPATFPTINYPAGSIGFWGFWFAPNGAAYVQCDFGPGNSTYQPALHFLQSSITLWAPGTSTSVTIPFDGNEHYFSLGLSYSGTTFTSTLYQDGGQVATVSATITGTFTNALAQPTGVRIFAGDGANVFSPNFSHLSHTPFLVHEEGAGITTEAQRIEALAQTMPQFVLGTVDPALSIAPMGEQSASGTAVLSMLQDLMRSEQGQIYCTTSGTLTNPTQVVNVRARTRPTAVQASFDASTEVSGVPGFVRDNTNMFSVILANGPSQSVTVTDPAAVPRVGSATDSETVVFENALDLQMWAEDRLQRGENVQLKVASVVIDALTSPAATATKLLGLTLGDRVEITNLPSGELGFSSWDGWLLGMSENHGEGSNQSDTFTLYLAPVLPATAIYDTNLYMSGGNNTLNAALTSTATSMTVLSADQVTYLEQTAVPYTLVIDSEQVTVTACGAPSAGVQTATITRHVNGTTAAAHSSGTQVEIATASLYAF